MAVFAVLLYSISEEIVCVADVFIRSGGSLAVCKEFILAKRRNYLIEEYIKKYYSDDTKMSTESIDSCDFAYKESESPRSISLDRSSSEVVFCLNNITEVSPGLSFVVSGTILLTCERFSINLLLNNSDLALHFNPRLPQNYIVRNCRINGSWGSEEVTSPLSFNLHRGKQFSVHILVTENEFLMSVNGQHFNAFGHRLPFKKIKSLEVKGDVKDVNVEQLYIQSYPEIRPEVIKQVSPNDFKLTDSIDPKLMPFTGRLAQPFTNGKHLHIKGRIKILPHSFFINLQKGYYVWPHPTIPFHFNPRFGNVGGKHIICRNSWLNGKWEKEERSENQTEFMPGKTFHLTISCLDESYQIFLNKRLIAEYKFRIDPRDVDTIYIQGDLKIYEVVLEAAY